MGEKKRTTDGTDGHGWILGAVVIGGDVGLGCGGALRIFLDRKFTQIYANFLEGLGELRMNANGRESLGC